LIPVCGTEFSPLQTSRKPLQPNQPFVHWVLGVCLEDYSSPSMKLTSHFHLVPRLRSEAITPIPLIPLWCVKESIYFTLVQNLSTDQTTNIENKKGTFSQEEKNNNKREPRSMVRLIRPDQSPLGNGDVLRQTLLKMRYDLSS